MEIITIGDSQFDFSKKIGGMCTSWKYKDKDIIFPFQKIDGENRGGIPICFPYFGPAPKGMEGLPRHGWLRDEKANVDYQSGNNLRFLGQSLPRNQYPWHLKYAINYHMESTGIRISLCVLRMNDDNKTPAPINPAFHPYLVSHRKSDIYINGEYSCFLKEISSFVISDKDTMVVRGDIPIGIERDGFGYLCLWSDRPKEYICPEPVLQPPELFGTKRGFYLAPEETLTLSMKLFVM